DQRWQTVLMSVIAGVTAIYALVSFLQWRSMERAINVSNRAYVSVFTASLNKSLKDWQTGDRPIAHVSAINKGNSPAVQLASNLCAAPKPVNESLPVCGGP